MGNPTVVWSNEAKKQLQEAFNYLHHNSVESAIKIRLDIIAITRNLPAQPKRYPADKYKIDNDGTYRAFEKHKYRIVYRVLPNQIRVIRIRHTKTNPLRY